VWVGGLPGDQFADTDKDTDVEPSLSKNGCSACPKKTKREGGVSMRSIAIHFFGAFKDALLPFLRMDLGST
jgi:hypothetical protein